MSDLRNPPVLPRRRFLRTLFGTAAAYTTPFLLDLDRMAAYAAGEDYRALVCVFLFGGNDSHNLIIPADQTNYLNYAANRTSIAIALSSLYQVAPANLPGQTFGFHPSTFEMANLFIQNKLAVVANVGNLVRPLTKAEYQAGVLARPPQLFSHSDQQQQWQTGNPTAPLNTGWGGRIADLTYTQNTNNTVSTSISIAGSNFLQRGSYVIPQSISTNGTKAVASYTPGQTTPAALAIQNMLLQPRRDLFEDYYMDTMSRSVDLNQIMATALPTLATVFPNTGIANQLKMVARIIGARATLGMKRQIFFCSLGGFDTHGGQIATQATLFQQLSQGLSAFYTATGELGIADKVTSFTASDFGRTYTSNGGGTDHGWGSHHLVMGGAVNGGRIFGTFPPPVLGASNPWDVGQGRLLPSTSIDQFGATLASWFGVSDTDLDTVFPNLHNFNPNRNIGFV
jgi:uncharacterized protein (DUF1501 family)